MNKNFNYIIKSNGYGSNFNILYLNDDKTLILKKTINNYGINKLKYEINFYKFILNNKINLPIPIIYYHNDDSIIMNYINNDKQENINYFDIIIKNLENLHNFQKIKINKNYYKQLLFEETIIKITERYDIIKHIINKYKILSVNNVKILNFNEIINKLTEKLNLYIDTLDNYILEPIHGDPQYNNIIFQKNQIYFIDPKGTFGSSQIYGIKEYDIAKIFFSLSGYYKFDNMIFDNDINKINIENDNLNIDFINMPYFDKYQNKDKNDNNNVDFIKYLFISIWLSNSHMFINQPIKLIYSYYIALYFSTLILQ